MTPEVQLILRLLARNLELSNPPTSEPDFNDAYRAGYRDALDHAAAELKRAVAELS